MSASEAERIRNKEESQPRMQGIGWQIWADIYPHLPEHGAERFNAFTLCYSQSLSVLRNPSSKYRLTRDFDGLYDS